MIFLYLENLKVNVNIEKKKENTLQKINNVKLISYARKILFKSSFNKNKKRTRYPRPVDFQKLGILHETNRN